MLSLNSRVAKWPERQAQLSLPALTTGTELGTLATTTSANGFERSVNGLFAGAPSVSGDKFRSWAANTPGIAPLFAPLSR